MEVGGCEQQLLWNRDASTPTLLKASKPCVIADVLNHKVPNDSSKYLALKKT